MIISQQVAQSIVEEVQKVVSVNINFMNNEGKIIASMNKNRIGDFHEGAFRVIETKETVVIQTDEKWVGAKQGLNLPVFLHHQIVGVIGITGDPDEYSQMAEIIRKMTEVLVREAYLDKQFELEERAKQSYIEEWIEGNWEDDKLFASRGWILGINIQVPRIAVIIDLVGFNDWIYQKLRNYQADVGGELEVQRIRREILRLIQDHFPEQSQHVIVPSGSTRYTLLLSVDEKITLKKRWEKVNYRLSKIQKAIASSYPFQSVAGIGRMYVEPREIRKSEKEAYLALQYAKTQQKQAYSYDQLGIESFVYELDPEVRNDYVYRILQPDEFPRLNQTLETMDVFFQENGSINRAAEKLFIHKNTLQYRLKKIYTITGYDPRVISDAVLLKIAAAFYQANELFSKE
ncbi:CdaR family transcriptional regulator [Halobacillus naozhouensis]|uniref:Sugar diacid recognition domain-containing protein n=1 Tax=Halobacillus naozhouensis TaxID=554880 RepID=A0ABY8IXZ5_9BACI|nr:sugar diacid recognition domain-containing protein [Halobacillus naozhouensis]WFT74217.1 sugar diacid recognition domain-containing protein [Halobacillus naozhouensis]